MTRPQAGHGEIAPLGSFGQADTVAVRTRAAPPDANRPRSLSPSGIPFSAGSFASLSRRSFLSVRTAIARCSASLSRSSTRSRRCGSARSTLSRSLAAARQINPSLTPASCSFGKPADPRRTCCASTLVLSLGPQSTSNWIKRSVPRQERTEKRICSRLARISRSGRIEERPKSV